MDYLCEYVKENVCVNFADVEIQDKCKAVDILMKRFVTQMQKDYPEINIKDVRFCGSMAEQTKIKIHKNELLEFDYLAVIDSWPGCKDIRFLKTGTCNCMFIEHGVEDEQSATGEKNCLSNRIGEMFVLNFVNSVTEKCKQNFCPRIVSSSEGSNDFLFGCCFCTVYMQSGNLKLRTISFNSVSGKLVFAWASKRDKPHCHTTSIFVMPGTKNCECDLFEIDFHAIFEINGSNMSLFPRACMKDLVNVGKWLSWRPSSQKQETKLIRASSEKHKLAFMALKYMFPKDVLEKDKYQLSYIPFRVGQYMLKNIFLLHIRRCKNGSQTAGECLRNMLDLLSKCCLESNLQHFLLKYNFFNTLNKEEDKFKAFGYCLEGISVLFSNPNVHNELQDIRDDLFTISTICAGSVKENENCLKQAKECLKKEENKEILIQNITSILIKDFLYRRQNNSAKETMSYFVTKYWRYVTETTGLLSGKRYISDEYAEKIQKEGFRA